jgi:hypothetical protein
MRSAFENECEQLRTRIARSRRRVDRRARDWTRQGLGGAGWQGLLQAGPHASWLSALMAGWALVRWLDQRSGSSDAARQALGPGASRWFDDWSRQIRVLARRYRRTHPRRSAEVDV